MRGHGVRGRLRRSGQDQGRPAEPATEIPAPDIGGDAADVPVYARRAIRARVTVPTVSLPIGSSRASAEDGMTHDAAKLDELAPVWPEIADQLGYVYALSSRIDEGLPLLEGALTAMESMGMIQWRTPVLVHLGEAYLLAG